MEKGQSKSSSSSTRAPRIERKIVEKNRRNQMKTLYSNLLCVLPDHASKEEKPLPDQIDEAVTYIESLKMKLEKMKEKKEFLMPRKRSHSCITSEIQANTKFPPPLVEVQDMGPNTDVILVSGLDDLSKFYSILHLLHQDGIEVVNANFSIHGNSTIEILHDKAGKSRMGFGATTISRKLKDLMCGSTCSEVESNLDLWDSEIQSDILGFGIQEFMNASFMNLFGGVEDRLQKGQLESSEIAGKMRILFCADMNAGNERFVESGDELEKEDFNSQGKDDNVQNVSQQPNMVAEMSRQLQLVAEISRQPFGCREISSRQPFCWL
ncbi:uncharacterized protein Fot_09328 [Forsythia ovata]|uniref:BHLH domain-containing protein n=1 Tax=Forsythia ovata TaxID=205694 RepID=A0ABD1WDP3_9LAMI